jgi:hypothetical protein
MMPSPPTLQPVPATGPELLDYAPAHHHTVYYSWQSGALEDFRHRNSRTYSAIFPGE